MIHTMETEYLDSLIQDWWAGADSPTNVVVACSGGVDSMSLAHTLTHLPDVTLHAVIVDHQLQPGSDLVAQAAAQTLHDWGYHHIRIKAVDIPGCRNLEERARFARYRVISEYLRSIDNEDTALLFAHHRDDQVETMLMGYARGSGLTSIKGMALSNGRVHRPLLLTSKNTIRDYAETVGITYWEDPTNHDPEANRRSKVRDQLKRVVADGLDAHALDNMAHTAVMLQRDDDYLNMQAQQLREVHTTPDGKQRLIPADTHPAISTRVAVQWMKENGIYTVNRHAVRKVTEVLTGDTPRCSVPTPVGKLGRYLVERTNGVLRLECAEERE